MQNSKIICGTSREVLKEYPDAYFDSVVTDPPYGIKFMGKKWDYQIPSVDDWQEIYRVLKPGAHILVACGTRTQHRMVCNIEDAGFEIRDVITWHYGSGFPKSLDISKAIDKKKGAIREVTGQRADILQKQAKDLKTGTRKITDSLNNGAPERNNGYTTISADVTAPATPEAQQWNGYGTAIKPATEFWTLARKPIKGTVAQNILGHGVGGLNIDGCRIQGPEPHHNYGRTSGENSFVGKGDISTTPQSGRFPSNVIFDEFTAELLDQQSGELTSGSMRKSYLYKNNGFSMGAPTGATKHLCEAYKGGASRFFYVAKASRSERNKGLENFIIEKEFGHSRYDKCTTCGGYILQNPNRNSHCKCEVPVRQNLTVTGNYHPTVKPVKLMQYLVRLITPAGGKCLDPYNGSGTTGIACKIEEFDYLGIEREPDFCEISEYRIAAWEVEKEDFDDSQLKMEFPE